MRPWSSLALLAVVLIKWISGAHGSKFFCFQPENYRICRILMEHKVAINKRFLRFGRNFGEPFLRFGRSGADLTDDDTKRLSSFEDKAYLRFGRSGMDDEDLMAILSRGPSNYHGWQYRRKRAADSTSPDVVHSRRRRSAEVASSDSVHNMVEQEGRETAAGKRQTYFPRFGRPNHIDVMNEEGSEFEKRPDRLSRSGWLHFGKRMPEI